MLLSGTATLFQFNIEMEQYSMDQTVSKGECQEITKEAVSLGSRRWEVIREMEDKTDRYH